MTRPATKSLLIDARSLGGTTSNRGIGTYVHHLLTGLATHSDLTTSALATNATRLPAGVGRVRISRRAPGRFATLEHGVRLPLDLARHRFDVFHSPGLDPPRFCSAPRIQTLHDVIPLSVSEPALSLERKRLVRYRSRLNRASRIITGSQYSSREITRHLGIDPERIEVIPYGVGPEFSPSLQRQEVDQPYILLVGEFAPTKGYPEAFEVVAGLADAGLNLRLRVAGQIAPWVSDALQAERSRARRSDLIDLLGYTQDLVEEYRRASAVIVTSRIEGFGFPALEAMACGIPVIAFSNSSLPEVIGSGGLLVDDGDVRAMVQAVESLAVNKDLWTEYSARGLNRARQFSWQTSASRHAEVFLSAAK
ncbi:MAG: glycosyltransferase family 4 protein [Acidimicrobiales bacterium]